MEMHAPSHLLPTPLPALALCDEYVLVKAAHKQQVVNAFCSSFHPKVQNNYFHVIAIGIIYFYPHRLDGHFKRQHLTNLRCDASHCPLLKGEEDSHRYRQVKQIATLTYTMPTGCIATACYFVGFTAIPGHPLYSTCNVLL